MTPAQYKRLRQRIGTQPEVAAALNLSRATVAGREDGTRRITEESAIAIRELVKKKTP